MKYRIKIPIRENSTKKKISEVKMYMKQCVTIAVPVLNVQQPIGFTRTKGIHEPIRDAFHAISDELDHLEEQDAAVYIRTKQLGIIILLF